MKITEAQLRRIIAEEIATNNIEAHASNVEVGLKEVSESIASLMANSGHAGRRRAAFSILEDMKKLRADMDDLEVSINEEFDFG